MHLKRKFWQKKNFFLMIQIEASDSKILHKPKIETQNISAQNICMFMDLNYHRCILAAGTVLCVHFKTPWRHCKIQCTTNIINKSISRCMMADAYHGMYVMTIISKLQFSHFPQCNQDISILISGMMSPHIQQSTYICHHHPQQVHI